MIKEQHFGPLALLGCRRQRRKSELRHARGIVFHRQSEHEHAAGKFNGLVAHGAHGKLFSKDKSGHCRARRDAALLGLRLLGGVAEHGVGFGNDKLADVLLGGALFFEFGAALGDFFERERNGRVHIDLIERDHRQRRVGKRGDLSNFAAVKRADGGHGAGQGRALELTGYRLVGAGPHQENFDGIG